jgi:hypothetical protein
MAATSPVFGRLPDGGPLYTETNLEHWIAEPLNAMTALPFLALAAYWLWRLRGRYHELPFLTGNLILLAVGGVGGTLYHAFRSSRLYFLMDVLPIGILALSLAVYFWLAVLPRRWLLFPVVLPFFLLHRLAGQFLPPIFATGGFYVVLAVLVVLPLLLALRADGYRDARLVVLTIGLFAVGLLCRSVDPYAGPYLAVGTHFLWHAFAALSVAALTRYVVAFAERQRSAATPSPFTR